MLIDEDPEKIEFLYQKMYRQSFWRMGVIGMSAISGIEQALWDIRGKALKPAGLQAVGRQGARQSAYVYPSGRRRHARRL